MVEDDEGPSHAGRALAVVVASGLVAVVSLYVVAESSRGPEVEPGTLIPASILVGGGALAGVVLRRTALARLVLISAVLPLLLALPAFWMAGGTMGGPEALPFAIVFAAAVYLLVAVPMLAVVWWRNRVAA